jgi:hypothetical protein
MSSIEALTSIPEFVTFQVKKHGEDFRPTHNEDDEKGINEAIEQSGIPIIEHNDWKLMAVEPTSAHHPHHGCHMVCWICKYEGNKLIPWKDTNIDSTPLYFIQKMEDYFITQQQRSPDLRVYGYSGYINPTRARLLSEENPIYRRGLPSQKRKHFHLTQSIPKETPSYTLNSNSPSDLVRIESTLNFAGEIMIEEFKNAFTSYGIQHEMRVTPLNTSIELERTLFGFDSLHDAMNYTHKLLSDVFLNQLWIDYSMRLPKQYMHLVPKPLRIQQTLVPTAVTLLPSQIDRTRYEFPNMAVFTFPFSIAGTLQLLDGASLSHYEVQNDATS